MSALRTCVLLASVTSASSRSFIGTSPINIVSFVISPHLSPISTRFYTTRHEVPPSTMTDTAGGGDITPPYDEQYPGTAVERLNSVLNRVAELAASSDELHGTWEEVRKKLLWAGGLRDLPAARPGQGYTGHSFNDYNHVDLTTMLDNTQDNLNDGSVKKIAIGNQLGPGIRTASLSELGPGGSWTTCANGCNSNPPNDVAHVQFRSRIAFKLVWVPTKNFDTFVLVDDSGKLLAKGTPVSGLPHINERQRNYLLVKDSKYAKEADAIAAESPKAAAE